VSKPRSLRTQLIISHVLPFVLILPLMGIVLLYLIMAQILVADLSNDLEERTALIAEAISRQPEVFSNPAAAQSFIAEGSIMVDGDIFLLDHQGELLAASPSLQETPVPAEAVNEVRFLTTGEPSVTIDYGISEQGGEAVAPIIDVNQQLMGIVGVRQRLEGVTGSFAQARRLILLTMLGGMLLGALIGLLLARRLAAPIAEAADAVHSIAAGRPAPPLVPHGPAEVRELSASVNVLSERLRLLEQTRQRSLANIVHELGRPLGAILAAVNVLRQAPGEDPAIRAELLAGVEQELEHMEPLLDDLSALHSEVTGQQRLDKRSVPTAEWLMAVLLPWRAAAHDKDQTWRAAVPPDLPPLSIDPDRMAQVIGNLLSNAVKYSPRGASIAVSAEADETAVRITVSDTGPGIAPEEQALVFEPFYRSRHPQRFSEGLGLGLSIARSLVEAHGGRLTLASTPGEGSAFTIELPRGDE
jgi:signal transduction histidine kinase